MSARYAKLAYAISTDHFPAAVPESLQHVVAALKVINATRAEVPSFAAAPNAPAGFEVRVAPVEFATQLTARLVDGAPMPPDFVEASYAAAVEDAKLRAADTALAYMTGQVENALDQVATDCTPQLLEGLRSILDQVLDETQATVDALEGYDVTNAAYLVTARDSIREAYARLPEHIKAYKRLRHAQDIVQKPDLEQRDREFWAGVQRAGWFEIRDVATFWPGWQQVDRDREATAPWPADPRARMIAVLDYEPWIPDVDEALLAVDEVFKPTQMPIVTAGEMQKRRTHQLHVADARRALAGTGDSAA